jgi:hypothetical protein
LARDVVYRQKEDNMEQDVKEAASTSMLDDLLNEWLCPNCPGREMLRDGIQAGIVSSNLLMKNASQFAMRYLKASRCEYNQVPATCGNLAVQGALNFVLEAQALTQGDETSKTA